MKLRIAPFALLKRLALRLLLGQGLGPLAAQLLILPFVVALSWLLIGRVMGFRHRRRVG